MRFILRTFTVVVLFSFLGGLAVAAQPFSPDNVAVSVDDAGRVGIVVELATKFVPEGLLLDQFGIAAQRSAIQRAQTALLHRLNGHNVESVHRFNYVPYISMYVDKAALTALEGMPSVVAIHPDRWSSPAITESVPLIGANVSGYVGTKAAVAVLDSGVDSEHPHLWQRVLSQACYSTNDANYSSLCPGGATSATGPGTGEPCTDVPICNHGTHVAGIASGRLDPYYGVAWAARLISIKVFSRGNTKSACNNTTPPCLRAKDTDVMKGLERVLYLHYNDPAFSYYRIAAVNMSFGSGTYTSNCDAHMYKAAIDNLRSVGIASVAAAGNSGYTNALNAPACISSAISVGNTTKTDNVWNTSNSASFLKLLAPGTSIVSPDFPGSGYSSVTGTSFAAPHVAGAFAQLKDKNPNATVSQMLNALVSTGILITDPRNNVTKPRIQVNAAINVLP